ncbi:MAG: hypothetical protein N3F03_03005 [Ignavibacteria bacterium]|nr:hypothetical protein [Ignavibacteria bacterium]
MKIILSFLFIVVFFFSCSKKTELTEQQKSKSQVTTIKENISYISAKVLEVNRKSPTNYVLKILILESNSDENLPNFAVVNEEIIAKPRFIINDKNEIANDDSRNLNLKELSKVKSGEIVKLTVTRTLNEGWLILDYQKNGAN